MSPLDPAIGLQALENFLAVMKNQCPRVQGQRPVRFNPGIFPTLSLLIVHQKQVIGEDLAEA